MLPSITRTSLVWLLVTQAFVLTPLFFFLPKWLPALWLCVVFWRSQVFRGAWMFPSKPLKYFLSFLCMLALFLSFKNALAIEPAVSFLVVSFILKISEMHYRRDAILVVNIGFICIAVSFLFVQSILFAIYALLACALIICSWISLYQPKKYSLVFSAKNNFLLSSKLVLQSLPLMLLLFLVMPRLGQLWNVPNVTSVSKTGFSDSMSPGDLSNLSQSDELAFRVSFLSSDRSVSNILPQANELYWRGLIFDDFDGRRWKHNSQNSSLIRANRSSAIPVINNSKTSGLSSDIVKEEDVWDYEVLMEPHYYPWLFVMRNTFYVSASQNKLYLTSQRLAIANSPITQRIRYIGRALKLSSAQRLGQDVILSKRELQQNTKLPLNFNPKSIAYAKELQLKYGTNTQLIVDHVLSLYRKSFIYTLQPPKLGKHSVDEFMFDSQKGFCEHFASSFVFFMRAAGIPARVVVGYQGGELNTSENYIRVRQSEAHAWAEVWFEKEGWRRVDPTASVAPSRIEQGLQTALSGEDVSLLRSALERRAFSIPLLQNIRFSIDALSYQWHRWVLSYDDERQKTFYTKWFGSSSPVKVAIILTIMIAIIFTLYLAYFFYSSRKQYRFEESRLFARLEHFLAKKNYKKQPGETILAYTYRIAEKNKIWEADLKSIGDLFNEVSYSDEQCFEKKNSIRNDNNYALVVSLKQFFGRYR